METAADNLHDSLKSPGRLLVGIVGHAAALELLNPQMPSITCQAIRPLRGDGQTEVLQCGQHVRQGIRLAGDIQLDPGRVTEQQPRPPWGVVVQRFEDGDVVSRVRRGHGADVSGLKRVAVPGHEPRGLLRRRPLGEFFAQGILPGACGLQQARLDLGRALFDLRPGPGPDQEMNPRKAIAHELDLALDTGGIEDLLQDLLHAAAHLPAVAVTRHVDQTGVKPAVAIATHQELQLLAVAQGPDRQGHFIEFAFAALKQFISRQ